MMSVEIQDSVPKPRRRPRRSKNTDFPETTANDIKLNESKMLEDIRQSIEKSDNIEVIKNNLYEEEVPDKMEKRRRHRKIEKLDGKDNPSFEPDGDGKDILKEENTDKFDEEKPQRRRRRKPKQDEIETTNEELSNQIPNQEVDLDDGVDGDTVKPRRRRKRRDKEELIETKDETEGPAMEINPFLIEDDGRALNIMIHRTDRLKTDLNVLHPMIRVHIIDISTGQPLIKQNRDRQVTSCNEDTGQVTTILPVITQPFDFKSRHVTIPAWEESLIFNENSNYLIKHPNVIYFFEVLDLNPAYSIDKTFAAQQESSGFHHIAWAFLRPVGPNGNFNTGHKVRLQLYENGPSKFKTNDSYTPNVYFWWQQGFRQSYPSTLYVTVASIKLSSEISSEFAMRSMFPNQKEGAPNGLVDSHLPGISLNKHLEASALNQWMKLPSQMCHIPNVPQIKFFAGADGANVLAFSPDGNWLACGAVEDVGNFPLLLYNLTSLSNHPSSTFNGHNRIIHNLAWCHKSELLASASADGTCRVWRVKKFTIEKESSNENPNTTDTLETDSNPAGGLFGDKRTLCHPCFVYTVAFHSSVNSILITAGYDKIIRIWDVSINKKEIIQQLDGHKGFINSVVFSLDGRTLYSGDAKGEIHIWNVPEFELKDQAIFKNKWNHQGVIDEQDLKGVIINHLVMHPNGKRLFVHSRDGSIRLIDLKIKAMVIKFRGFINSEKNLRCCLTPCGSFLFCGSEDCSSGSQVFVWNAQTGDHVALYKELGFSGAVSSIDYHPKCHMIAFTAIGNESSILIYTYNSEQAHLEIGTLLPRNSLPDSPRLQSKKLFIHQDNMTKLDETTFKSRNFEHDENEFTSFKREYDRKNMDRMTRILNTLNTVKDVDRTLRSTNRSMERGIYSSKSNQYDGYISGPEDKGRMMRSSKKGSTLQSIPMTLDMTSTTKANFTFKPPPFNKHKEQSNKYLGEVVALYDYQAQRSDEISFARGEIIKIVFRDGNNWLLGETSEGKQGYLPTNYVAGEESLINPIISPREIKNQSSTTKITETQLNGDYEVSNNSANIPPMNPVNKEARSRRRRSSIAKETIS